MLPKPGDFFAVMYHYVRPAEESALRYIELNNFQKHLDFFEKNYGLVSRSQWERFRETGYKPTGALLTFDDGLKDHFRFVLPALLERGIFAIFYICTNPLKNLALPVNLTHYMLANHDAEIIWNKFNSRGSPLDLNRIFDDKSQLAYVNRDHSFFENELKRLVNYASKDVGQTNFLFEIFTELTNLTQKQFIEMWYMNEVDILDVNNKGFEIGSHTCSHRLMSRLTDPEIDYELRSSKNILGELSKTEVKSFCFPFGRAHSYNSKVLNKLEQSGYSESFDVNPQPIDDKFLKSDTRFQLPRYDCILFNID